MQTKRLNVKGVNLGNWLVLEKWMSPALFAGTDAEDEYYLPRRLSRDAYEARIAIHRAEYITERDFVRIRAMGMDMVRIPVPYFIFGDREPFIGCIGELDKAFGWAERYGLKILIDLHTAPMGQNGFDNGGICGVCKWAQCPDEVEFELTVLERLAERYGQREGLWGIEVLNEPVMEKAWERMAIQERYVPVDKEMAEGSGPVPIAFLRDFYEKAYERMRRFLPEEKYVVIHDGFDLTAWKDFMREDKYVNVVLDTHMYLMGPDCGQNVEEFRAYIEENFARRIEEMQQYFPVVCGEWCLSNGLIRGGSDGTRKALSDAEKKEIYLALADAQLSAWKKGSGYIYWSYKLLIDTVNSSGNEGTDSWDLGRCADFGWFPV